jgi:hypothetical protein
MHIHARTAYFEILKDIPTDFLDRYHNVDTQIVLAILDRVFYPLPRTNTYEEPSAGRLKTSQAKSVLVVCEAIL